MLYYIRHHRAGQDFKSSLLARDGSLREAEADRREAYDDLQRGYAVAQPGTPTGLSPLRSEMSYRTPPPMYSAQWRSSTQRLWRIN